MYDDEMLEDTSAINRIIILTSGAEVCDDEVLEYASRKGIQIHVVVVGGGGDTSLLQRIAEYTNGTFSISTTAVSGRNIKAVTNIPNEYATGCNEEN